MTRDGHIRALLALAVLAAFASVPSAASAATETHTVTSGPITVGGYQVKQEITGVSHPRIDGHITRMEVDIVDENGVQVPIRRLMLHHIVFLNLAQRDNTCNEFTSFDSETTFGGLAPERFYAAGEERAKMALPDGYGYRLGKDDPWAMTYMVMNHRPKTDSAFIQYKITVDDSPGLTEAEPYWLDAVNCQADPIYNVPGTGGKNSTHTRSRDFVVPTAGRLIAGGGHVHGGARELSLTQPDCGDRQVGESLPTWGKADHPFYNVKPVLHEPGPIDMSAFGTATGIPIAAGQKLRLNTLYDNSLPHTRVMGIMVVYIAHDEAVTDGCGPIPGDIQIQRTSEPGRTKPIPYEVPLTGLNDKGRAVSIKAPPGKLRKLPRNGEVSVADNFFAKPNIKVRKGSKVNWRFDGSELHNVTLANGPQGFGSPNLDGGRVYSQKFKRKGTYRLFCGLHPVQMQERVVVRGK